MLAEVAGDQAQQTSGEQHFPSYRANQSHHHLSPTLASQQEDGGLALPLPLHPQQGLPGSGPAEWW